jgi:hypothetical protein
MGKTRAKYDRFRFMGGVGISDGECGGGLNPPLLRITRIYCWVRMFRHTRSRTALLLPMNQNETRPESEIHPMGLYIESIASNRIGSSLPGIDSPPGSPA